MLLDKAAWRGAGVLFAGGLVLAGCSSPQGSTGEAPAAGGTVVTTQGLSFTPAEITVKKGTTVTWRNSDGISHTVTFGTYELSDGVRTSETPSGMFDQGLAGTSATVSYTFNEVGTFSYYCKPHRNMNAKVTVTE